MSTENFQLQRRVPWLSRSLVLAKINDELAMLTGHTSPGCRMALAAGQRKSPGASHCKQVSYDNDEFHTWTFAGDFFRAIFSKRLKMRGGGEEPGLQLRHAS
jgi:hypothetical protein